MFTPYVLLFIRKESSILLLRRYNTKFGNGLYALPGGKVEDNESARHAGAREAFEEVGITIAPDDLQFVHLLHRKGDKESLFAVVFNVPHWTGEPFNKEPEKHDDLRWVPLDRLPETILPAHEQIIGTVLKNENYSEHDW